MPVSFTPDNIPRFDSGLLGYLNVNFQRLKNTLANVASEAITTIAPTSPYVGQRYTNMALGIEYIWTGSIWQPINHFGAWTDYSPTWKQSATTITKTDTMNGYTKEGKTIQGRCYLTATGAGAANSIHSVTVPVTSSSSSNQTVGSGYFYDASVGSNGQNVPFIVYLIDATTFCFVNTANLSISPTVSMGQTGSDSTAAVASGDVITFFYRYMSAS